MELQEFDYTFKLNLHSEWYDAVAQKKKCFILSFFPSDKTVELYDVDQRKIFLRRAAYDGLKLKDIYVGNTLTIYGRLIKLTDYADGATRNFIGRWKEHTFAMIKPSGMNHLGDIINEIYANDFTIERLRMAHLGRKETIHLYELQKGDSFLPFVIEHVSSNPIVALELVGENAMARWRDLMGPTDPVDAKRTAPKSFRARYGYDKALNAVHGSSSYEEAQRSACFFFPEGIDSKPPATRLKLKNSTCCIIKSHAVDENKLGHIINAIVKADFYINAMRMVFLSPQNAEEILEVYKGVVTDFHAFLYSFLDGPCIAMEISAKDDSDTRDIHQEFRAFCGPCDTDVARQIRPRTLRGMFGVDKYRNAVHCTDLAEDTVEELTYFFKILD